MFKKQKSKKNGLLRIYQRLFKDLLYCIYNLFHAFTIFRIFIYNIHPKKRYFLDIAALTMLQLLKKNLIFLIFMEHFRLIDTSLRHIIELYKGLKNMQIF